MKNTENFLGKKSFVDSLSSVRDEDSQRILDDIFPVHFFAIITRLSIIRSEKRDL